MSPVPFSEPVRFLRPQPSYRNGRAKETCHFNVLCIGKVTQDATRGDRREAPPDGSFFVSLSTIVVCFKKIQNKNIRFLASALIIGAVFIGNAAYEAGNITGAVLGLNNYIDSWTINPFVLIIGIVAFILLYSGQYKFIERFLIALVAMMGFVFMIACFVVQPDLIKILKGMFVPSIPEGSLLMVIGLIGTTVVPYNLFLHASTY